MATPLAENATRAWLELDYPDNVEAIAEDPSLMEYIRATFADRFGDDLSDAFKAASFHCVRAAVGGRPVAAQEWAQAAKAIADVHGVTRTLEVADGDTIIIHAKRHVDDDDYQAIKRQIEHVYGPNVRVLIFDQSLELAGVISAPYDISSTLHAERDIERGEVEL